MRGCEVGRRRTRLLERRRGQMWKGQRGRGRDEDEVGTRTGRGRGEDEDERTRGRSRDLLEFGSCGRVDGHPGRSTGVGRGSWLLGVGLALAPEKEGERRASHER